MIKSHICNQSVVHLTVSNKSRELTMNICFLEGEMWTVGDLYIFSVDVSEFASEVIHLILGLFICVFTQYLMDAVCQKCQFPADVGPMSVTSSLEKGGLLSIKAQKHTAKCLYLSLTEMTNKIIAI
uniref:Uncharacterized protein n=2 Tax=Cyprinus carpio TaxID=7962 RepID=A0A9J8CQA0_CYPCA